MTLDSIRNYAEETSGAALSIALSWFKVAEPGSNLIGREEDAWTKRLDRIARGLSLAMEEAGADQQN
jgi:hypothetical protein